MGVNCLLYFPATLWVSICFGRQALQALKQFRTSYVPDENRIQYGDSSLYRQKHSGSLSMAVDKVFTLSACCA